MYLTPDDLLLLQIILGITVLIHLVYISFLFGGTFISLLLYLGERGRASKIMQNPFRSKCASDIVNMAKIKWSAALVLVHAQILCRGAPLADESARPPSAYADGAVRASARGSGLHGQ